MKLFKRFSTVLLVVCLLCMAIPSSAFETVEFAVTTISNARVGEAYDMAVSISENSNAHTMIVYVNYDPTLVGITDVQKGTAAVECGGLVIVDQQSISDNHSRLAFSVLMPSNPFMAGGDLLTFKATLLGRESAPLTLEVIDLINMPINVDPTYLSCELTNGGLFFENDAPTITPVLETPAASSTAASQPTGSTASPDVTSGGLDATSSPLLTDDPANTSQVTSTDTPTGTGDTQQTSDVNADTTPADQNTKNPAEAEPSSNTPWILYGAIGALALVAVACLIFKKKSAK